MGLDFFLPKNSKSYQVFDTEEEDDAWHELIKKYVAEDFWKYETTTAKGGSGSGHFDHAGRPGLVGGSRPKNGAPVLPDNPLGAIDFYIKSEINENHRPYHMEAIKTASTLKDKVIGEISSLSGLGYQETNELVRAWAVSSNYGDESSGLQKAVSEEFGLPLSEWQEKLFNSESFEIEGEDFGDYRRFVRAVYDNTQAFLGKMFPGATHLYLYRGVVLGEDDLTYETNTIESWTLDKNVAGHFAESDSAENVAILSAVVPVDKVFSTALSGMGCFSESEFIIFGGDHNISIERFYNDGE